MTNKTSGGTTLSSFSYGYNDDDLRTSCTEANGDVVSYGYDGAGRLTSESRTGSSAYSRSYVLDGVGNRTSQTVGGVTTRFLRDGERVLLEKQGTTTVAVYAYGNALIRRGGEYPLSDGLGSERTVTNANQTVVGTITYEGFGQTIATTGSSTNPYKFAATSGYRDDGDAGLLHVGARYYDPQVGRFITRDTYLDEHPYLYCEHDPVNHLDPSGHRKWGLAQYVGFIQALVDQDWDTVIMLVEIVTAVEIPQGVKDAITKVPVPKGLRVNLNTVGDVRGLADHLRRHIKKAVDESTDARDYNHHLTEIRAAVGNIYKKLPKDRKKK